MDQNIHNQESIDKLKSLLVLPHKYIHAVGGGWEHNRKVYFARQVPYRVKGREDVERKFDRRHIWYKVYTIIENELLDLTKLVAEAYGLRYEFQYGVAEPIGTGYIANVMRNTIAVDLKSWGI